MQNNLDFEVIQSPMFLTTRLEFSEFINSAKLEPSYKRMLKYLNSIGWRKAVEYYGLEDKAHHPSYDAMMTLGVIIGLSHSHRSSIGKLYS